MSKNRTSKAILIAALVAVAAFVLLACTIGAFSVARHILRPTIDMTGGTSLVYEIDAQSLSENEKKDLSQRMITVLRRRVGPRGTLPIVWRPLGDMRFEIQISPAAGSRATGNVQRMLKGAGVLEFRILPTQGHPDVDMDEMKGYAERLKEKGPTYASDKEYVWCEIENIEEWKAVDGQGRPTIVARFGEKFCVLASNKPGEAMLYRAGKAGWRLKNANPTTDRMGRRAIGFLLDEKGGDLFADVTGDNIGKPLCILLDEIAVSAPNVESRIRRQGVITGSFTQTQVEDTVNRLNAGRLPAKLIEQPISIRTIGPSVDPDKPDNNTGIERNLSKNQL
jgi:preprotein translocase subunit SecD